jgi:hypothetical protein
MAVSEAVKLEREKRKTMAAERRAKLEDRMLDVVLSPNMVRLGIMSAIIAYSTHCARSKENVGPVQSALAMALPGIGIPLLAADAGIRDKYALAAISAAGTAYATGQMVAGWKEAGILPDPSRIADEISSALTDISERAVSWVNPFG